MIAKVPEPVRQAFESAPVNRHLGLRLHSCGGGRARISMPVREEYLQEEGVVQGGILTALADTCAVYALVPELPSADGIAGVELKVNFLRPGLRGRGELEAGSRLVHRGTRLALCEAEVRQEDRLLLRGSFTFILGAEATVSPEAR